jgi:hypothetical protein
MRSNLLLSQAPNQQLNQSRLETYFSSSSQPTLEVGNLDLSTHLDRALSNGHQSSTGLNGTNTPKDLTSRIKVLEIFTLHVLPRNSEWDYARSFIQNSDILDEERREAFLQTLEELQDVTRRESFDAADVDEVFEDTEEHPAEETRDGPEQQSQSQSQSQEATSKHQRTSSEVDYGIERAHPNGATQTTAPSKQPTGPTATPKPPQPTSTPRSPPPPSATPTRTHFSPPAQTPRRPAQRKSSRPTSQNTLAAQARALFQALSNLARSMATSLQKNPTAVLRLLLFVLMFVVVAGQKHIREKAKRVLGRAWEKLRGTVGMGVKVSYI